MQGTVSPTCDRPFAVESLVDWTSQRRSYATLPVVVHGLVEAARH